MNTILIIALVVLVISTIVVVIKNGDLKEALRESVKTNNNLSADVSVLKREGRRLDAISNNQSISLENLNDELASAKISMNSKGKALLTSLIFVTNIKTKQLAVNVKVKTNRDAQGNIVLHPTIRRKVNEVWKEVPVYLMYK